MNKQEEIEKGMYKILKRHVKASLVQGGYLDGCTKLVSREIAQYLHSQGVVIKVEQECANCGRTDAIMYNPYNQIIQCHNCGEVVDEEEPKDRYVAVEQLTEEETEGTTLSRKGNGLEKR